MHPEVFCALPWTHASVSVVGTWGRCCYDNTNFHESAYQQAVRPDLTLAPNAIGCIPGSDFAADNPDRVLTPSQVLNSAAMRTTRAEMMNGQPPDACSRCYWLESQGATSHRQTMNAVFARRIDLQALVDQSNAVGETQGQLLSIDLRLGNTCGLQCIMCSFPTSSGFGPSTTDRWSRSHIDPFHANGDFWDDLDACGAIDFIYFAGGEPFLQRSHLPLLDRLIAAGRAPQIALEYNSNLMQLPDAYLDRFTRFKSVAIAASCDGVGATFERIRRGAKWDTFLRNLRRANAQVDVWLDVAVQVDNVMELGAILDIAEGEGVRVSFGNIVFHPADLSITTLSGNRRTETLQYVTGLAERCRSAGYRGSAADLDTVVSTLSTCRCSGHLGCDCG